MLPFFSQSLTLHIIELLGYMVFIIQTQSSQAQASIILNWICLYFFFFFFVNLWSMMITWDKSYLLFFHFRVFKKRSIFEFWIEYFRSCVEMLQTNVFSPKFRVCDVYLFFFTAHYHQFVVVVVNIFIVEMNKHFFFYL